PNGSRVRFDRTNLIPFSIDIGTTENLVVNGLGGDDTITASNGLAGLIQLTLDGGAGHDTITAGDGHDTPLGRHGAHLGTGGRASDVAFLGDGDDTFVWNPGDNSDRVDGQGGYDTLQFNGSNDNENFELSAAGSRLQLLRNVGNVTMDVIGVEQVDLNALGGSDVIIVNDLTGTGVFQVNIDLASPAGSGTGDGMRDTVI